MSARLAVFLSGSGRTMVNLYDRCADGTIDGTIELVVSSKEGQGAERARERGIPTIVIPGTIDADTLESLAAEYRLDYILLGGYLRHIPVPPSLTGRIVNIHPALLPGDGTAGPFGGQGMYGMHVHRAVIEAGERESGCTVHLVSDVYDAGPVILTKTCPIDPGETPDQLAARVFALECEAYPEAVQRLIAEAGRTG